mgnify:CR=1 FL=1|tara:strand:+ start:4870 stop:5226 length:357 start_codon:yes stop_codon:yes gene_type:complete
MSSEYDFPARVFRNNYNSNSPAFIALRDDHVSMGLPFQNIEMSEDGVNINAGAGGMVAINCLTYMGPFVMKTPWPFDMIPGIVSPFPGGLNYASGITEIAELASDAAALMRLASPSPV